MNTAPDFYGASQLSLITPEAAPADHYAYATPAGAIFITYIAPAKVGTDFKAVLASVNVWLVPGSEVLS